LCAGAGQHVEGEVAASFDPFVVLFGEHGADQAVTASRSGKMPTTSVRRRISRLSRSFGLFDQTGARSAFGKAVKARMSAGGVEVFGDRGQLVARSSSSRSNWACTASASGWS
jgi:hypothetical protein